MLNQIILVGRLTRDIEVHESENGGRVATLSLAIPRSFKNAEGSYDTDFVECTAFDVVAENTSEYCQKGDIVGIKGRVQTRQVEHENGEKETLKEIIAERVTFLSSKKEKEEQGPFKETDDEMEM